jgi:hypothetical protein
LSIREDDGTLRSTQHPKRSPTAPSSGRINERHTMSPAIDWSAAVAVCKASLRIAETRDQPLGRIYVESAATVYRRQDKRPRERRRMESHFYESKVLIGNSRGPV